MNSSIGDRSTRVKRWLERLNRSERALALLFTASFLETIIVPIPIELVLIPFMLTNRDRLWRTALVVTLGCLVAAVVGYGVGVFAFETAGRWAVETFGWDAGYTRFRELFADHGFWAIVAIGVIPIPFQVAMLAAGAADYPLPLFVLAATIARSVRYFGLATLVRAAGDRAHELWERNRAAAIAAVLVVIGLFWGVSQWLGSRVYG